MLPRTIQTKQKTTTMKATGYVQASPWNTITSAGIATRPISTHASFSSASYGAKKGGSSFENAAEGQSIRRCRYP